MVVEDEAGSGSDGQETSSDDGSSEEEEGSDGDDKVGSGRLAQTTC